VAHSVKDTAAKDRYSGMLFEEKGKTQLAGKGKSAALLVSRLLMAGRCRLTSG
jgi:hypothetical protein